MTSARLFDISPPLAPGLAVWPGDRPLAREVLLDLAQGDPVTLSSLHATAHLGAHADAPCHVVAGAPAIDQAPLAAYLGPCQVIHVRASPGAAIAPGDLGVRISAERVLVATGTWPDPRRWSEGFAGLSPELADHLHAAGVILAGIDTPSVDPFAAADLPAHRRLIAHRIAILEGLVLKDVPADVYELIALPLRLAGFDGSPVRAVLRDLH
jgi:arylformamidase